MDDPTTPTLPFGSTSLLAGNVAAQSIPARYSAILHILMDGPAAIWQIAIKLKVLDHQISGRFGELCGRGFIRPAGRRIVKPATGCATEVYELTTEGIARVVKQDRGNDED